MTNCAVTPPLGEGWTPKVFGSEFTPSSMGSDQRILKSLAEALQMGGESIMIYIFALLLNRSRKGQLFS